LEIKKTQQENPRGLNPRIRGRNTRTDTAARAAKPRLDQTRIESERDVHVAKVKKEGIICIAE
jgi:hypothetical protein